jgi:tripartite-type tricarboxylate transporter receptor subunit TctC
MRIFRLISLLGFVVLTLSAHAQTYPSKSLDDPSVKKRLGDLGGSIPTKQERTPASFARLVKAEVARWSPILKAASLAEQ